MSTCLLTKIIFPNMAGCGSKDSGTWCLRQGIDEDLPPFPGCLHTNGATAGILQGRWEILPHLRSIHDPAVPRRSHRNSSSMHDWISCLGESNARQQCFGNGYWNLFWIFDPLHLLTFFYSLPFFVFRRPKIVFVCWMKPASGISLATKMQCAAKVSIGIYSVCTWCPSIWRSIHLSCRKCWVSRGDYLLVKRRTDKRPRWTWRSIRIVSVRVAALVPSQTMGTVCRILWLERILSSSTSRRKDRVEQR